MANIPPKAILQTPGVETPSSIVVAPDGGEMLRVGLLGVMIGALIPFVAWLLQRFFISPIFCRGTSASAVCSPVDITPYYIATIVVTVMAVALMANWQVFRSLLVAVAAASALWGLHRYLGATVAHAGWEYYVSSAVLWGLAFLLFYWLLRLKSFMLSVVLTVVAVVFIRWVLLS